MNWEIFSMSRRRKHGVFAVSGNVVVLPSKNSVARRGSLTTISALETVFLQMRIAGN